MKGQVINLYPWEFNEVPVLLGRALKEDVPIIILNLTRPPIEIPDREALGLASYFESAHGAYILKDYENGKEKMGVVIVQGTSPVSEIIKIIPKLREEGLNVKIVVASSYELFMRESEEYRNKVNFKR